MQPIPLMPSRHTVLYNKVRVMRYELWAWRIACAALIAYIYFYPV